MANNQRVAWLPPYDFSAAKTTFIDAWPKAWRDLAPGYDIVPVDRIEMNALGAQIMGFRHWFTPASTQPLIHLAHRLDAVIAKQNRACFIRLSSRSPKDSIYALRNGLCIRDGAQALAIILEGSERCAADLRMAAHSFVADKMSNVPSAVTDAIRNDTALPDERLSALAKFTRVMVEQRGLPQTRDVEAFLAAGYSERQILEIILAIAVKTLSNYTNHLFHTPVDAMFASRTWEEPRSAGDQTGTVK